MEDQIVERLLAFDGLMYKEKALIREGKYDEVIAILRNQEQSGQGLAIGIAAVGIVASVGLVVWTGEISFDILFWVVFVGIMWFHGKREQAK